MSCDNNIINYDRPVNLSVLWGKLRRVKFRAEEKAKVWALVLDESSSSPADEASWQVTKQKGHARMCFHSALKPQVTFPLFTLGSASAAAALWLKTIHQTFHPPFSSLLATTRRGLRIDLRRGVPPPAASDLIQTGCNVSHTLWIQFVWWGEGCEGQQVCSDATRWQCGGEDGAQPEVDLQTSGRKRTLTSDRRVQP